MEVFINQKSYLLPESSTLSAVLEALQVSSPRGLAMAVNDQVVPKDRWAAFELRKHDRVLLIKATQGG